MTKTVFITGATSGFGEACAELFAQNNYRVIITGRRQERLDALANKLRKNGTDVLPLCFDVRDKAIVNSSFKALPPNWQTIDVLINNAGLASGMGIYKMAIRKTGQND